MLHGLPRRVLPVTLLMAAAIAVVAAVATARATGGAVSTAPAPPPSICRPAPDAGWPVTAADGPVADLAPWQDYRAALGIGDGLRGAGVRVADVEYEWDRGHAELDDRALPASPVTGLPENYQATDHGTAVLAVLGARSDGQGVTGLVPASELRPVSPFAGGGYNPAKAVADAASDLGPGDVLLIELQAMRDQDGVRQLVPIEAIPDVRARIREAVDRGITVVEPAGNGGVDVAAGGEWLAGPGAPGYSGALIVGAGGSPSDVAGGSDLRRVPGSNYGARVDVQGVGGAVVTAGYGELVGGPPEREYTACFDGTSSASATVAGAVAALQSGAVAATGEPLTPAAVRELLIRTGTPQVAPADGAIGPRPQVDAALAALAQAPPPADGGLPAAVPAASPTTGAPVIPVKPAVTVTTRRPALSGATAAYVRAKGTLILRLRGLAPGALVTVRGHRVRVASGRVVVKGVTPGRVVVKVEPPARLRATRRAWIGAVVIPPKRGTPRVVRL